MIERLMAGGWVMLPLVICSVISVAVIIERWFYFQKAAARHCGEEVIELTGRGLIQEALRQVQESDKPIANVLKEGLRNLSSPGKAMETAGLAEIAAMKRGLPALDTIITLSPLLGLLGTIIGMINAFQIMSSSGLGQPHAVTGGVGEALIATAAGITVAAVTLIPYNYFLAKIDRETGRIEEYATRLELILGEAGQGR